MGASWLYAMLLTAKDEVVDLKQALYRSGMGCFMSSLSKILPAYTPDLGGVCSALFELGGMLIIHDAAGCTENYTTYDEPAGSAATLCFLAPVSPRWMPSWK